MTHIEEQGPSPRLRDLFVAGRTPATVLLGAGIGLEAVEFYVTTSLMPSMVRDIGGLELLAWTTSLFVAAIVLGTAPTWVKNIFDIGGGGGIFSQVIVEEIGRARA